MTDILFSLFLRKVAHIFEAGGHKKMRLSWLTNSALVYEPKYGGRGGVAESQPVSTVVYMEPK